MISGESIEVSYRTLGAEDEFGNQKIDYTDFERIENVICYQSDTGNDFEDGAPTLTSNSVTFLFPKTYHGKDLRGARIKWAGKTYTVEGDPHAYPCHMCPTSWNMRVRGELYE